jgi:ribosomal protein S4
MKDSTLYKTLIEEFKVFIEKNKKGTLAFVKWVEVDADKLSITIKTLPTKDDFDQTIDIQKIIEFYSK